jgi:hypothetical protein
MSGIALNADALLSGNMPMARMPLGGTWTLTTLPLALALNSQFFNITGGGVYVGAPTGGNLGAGTLNAQGLYINGVPLSAGSTIPSGLMATFDSACPSGWTLVNLGGRFILYDAVGGGGLGGSNDHQHTFEIDPASIGDQNLNTGPAVGETSGPTSLNGQFRSFDSGSSFSGWLPGDGNNHTHTIGHIHSVTVPGHQTFPGVSKNTFFASNVPVHVRYVLCRKD